MWAVTVGTDMRGYTPLFGSQVRFVLLGGKEISTSTLLRWVFIHMALDGVVLLIAVSASWRAFHRRATGQKLT